MPVVLARVDDRLIHGQVTEGWGKTLAPEMILVVSDKVSGSEWECELCLASLPYCITGRIVTVANAPKVINELNDDARSSYVLFESPHDAYHAVKNGAKISKLNVGGMHSSRGKREVIDYIFIDEVDEFYLKALRDEGVELDFRDLPDHENVDGMARL